MRKITSSVSIRRYAIGDLHGCLAEAKQALDWCADDAAADGVEAEVILLGDYIDKGPFSRQVIELLLAGPSQSHVKWIALRGNHDDLLMRVWLDHADQLGAAWWEHGGQETLMSYGWNPLTDVIPGQLSQYVPEEHVRFIEAMPLVYETDDLIFVHAGLRPEIDIDDQSDRDLLWIRGAFLNENHDFGKPVVHGHSPERANPVASQFKVSLDTACFGTGRLAIARFEPGERAPTLKVIGPKEMETHREPEIPNVLTQ